MWCDCGHGSLAIDSLHGPACPVLGTNEVVTFGPVSVNTAHSEVPTQQGQYSCQCAQSESTPSYRGYKGGFHRGGSFAVDEQFSRATS